MAGMTSQVRKIEIKYTIYSQAEPGNTVIDIKKSGVRLSATTQSGKEAVIDILGPGKFYRRKVPERCVGSTENSNRNLTLYSLRYSEDEMRRVLQTEHPFANVFI